MAEEMEDNEVVYTFTVVEIDLDYEFDAVRYFDFSREESLAEARQAELWFDTAPSYPPSPFVARLFTGNDALLNNVNTSPKPKHDDGANLLESYTDIEVDEETSAVEKNGGDKEFKNRGTSANLQTSTWQRFQNQHQRMPSGLTFNNHTIKDGLKDKPKSSVKTYLSRTSTLMKPTASQLARQNQPHQMCPSRFQKQLVGKNEKSSNSSCGVEIQAAKRQKLEGGHFSKIGDTKHQVNFVHKDPKRDGPVGNTMQAKLRINIAREPDLETTSRAQRIRPKTGEETQSSTSTVPRFKALPLNRKMLEVPSLLVPKRSTPRVPEFREFHLKTSERAALHAATASVAAASCSNSNKDLRNRNSTAQCRDETRRGNVADTLMEGSDLSHNFKALPLNRKIFSSKGDIGVFRNSKRDITIPMEFNFRTDKRVQHNPPIELFNKLSLASEPKSKMKERHPASLPAKGSKENRWDSFQQEHKVKHDSKEKQPLSGGKQMMQFSSNVEKNDFGLISGISRSLGVR